MPYVEFMSNKLPSLFYLHNAIYIHYAILGENDVMGDGGVGNGERNDGNIRWNKALYSNIVCV